MTVKILKGDAKFSIGYANGGSPEDSYVSLTVEDNDSHTQMLELHIDLTAWAEACFARGSRPATFTLNPDMVGKIAENKRVQVPMPYPYPYPSKTWEKFYNRHVAPFEIDGWEADNEPNFNQHRMGATDPKAGTMTYEVIFRRYVDKKEKP